MILEEMKWDSDFFGYPVAKLNTDQESFDEERLAKQSSSYRLVYVTSPTPITDHRLVCGDTKVVFSKKPMDHGPTSNVVEVLDAQMAEAKEIGRQSGAWSRFALDKRFNTEAFGRLYDTWVERSVRKEIAFKTLTILQDSTMAGLITLAEDNPSTSSIGLFAVADGFRGKGIGKQLLKAADTISFKRGYTQLNVATQGKNQVAREVYQRFGFEITSETYIYNYWNEAFAIQ